MEASRWVPTLMAALAVASAGGLVRPGRVEAQARPAAPVAGRLIDEVVAVVRPRAGEARVITLSRLSEEGRIALVAHGGLEAASRSLDPAALRASLEYLVDQLLLHEEAVRLKVFEVDRADALAALARFKEVFVRPEDYRAFLHSIDVTEEELLAVLRRTIRVRRYLDSRLGRARPGEPDDRAEAETRRIVADLRARADVRVLVKFTEGE